MLKQKKQVPLTEQKITWEDQGVFDTFEGAKAKYTLLKNEGKNTKIHLQTDGFHVKVGTPIKK